jgi:preprotein translocase subunit SecF
LVGGILMRRSERIQKKFAFKAPEKKQDVKEPVKEKKSFYNKYYKQLLIIPILILVLSLVVIGFKIATTGNFINKDITLKGGTSVTITKANLDQASLGQILKANFPTTEVNIRVIEDAGVQIGLIIESDIPSENEQLSNQFVKTIKEQTSATDQDISVETIGVSLGNAFFKQTMIALLVAFVLMAIVVFLYFKIFVPSALVILSAATDIIITVAALDVFNIKVGTAGIAALLMLIGYSVDTDILLTMRVLKRREHQTVYGQTMSSFKTGIMMSGATLVAVLAGLTVAQSPVLRQIMIIVVIGILADILNTWIQNAGLLRWYLERKGEL